MTVPLTPEEQRLLVAIEKHIIEHNEQMYLNVGALAVDLGLDPVEAVPRLLEMIGKLCRERGLGYSIMEGGGLKPS